MLLVLQNAQFLCLATYITTVCKTKMDCTLTQHLRKKPAPKKTLTIHS